MGILKLLFVTNLLLLLPFQLQSANTYNVGDPVPLFVNKIGPLHNPSETYQYYELAFCHPDQVLEEKESLGEVLNGDRLANALYQLEFAVNKTEGNWTDDGKGPKYFLFTHVEFDALYNGNQVIEIHAFSDPSHAIDVTEDVDVKVDFTYSVSWKRTSTPYKNRMDRYSAASLLPILQKTHWFSFVNSIVIVILLMGLLTVLFMRHLKNDIRKWSIGDEDEEKEVGWKYIHGDVFRCPRNLPLFSAILGSGTQLLSMVLILFVLAFLGVFHPYSRGTLSSSILISYILTTVVAGYSSASFCSQYAETGWERSALLAGILFSGPFLLTAFFLNILAAYFNVTTALPLGTILLIFLIYTLVAIPLLVLGGVVGHRYKSDLQSFPVTKKCPREIPSLSWYRKTQAQMFLAGLLPFSAIVLELHNLCATIWGYKIYTSPGILFVTFVILAMLTAILSVWLDLFSAGCGGP
ncbi:UNVERIFIED_CONTAM: Transmembrane 9 superfamily member 5 [Sesamum calycinum]|uniref:Transmembrane 9 superfamily member n=1 Tax=Sesamum calycinum TaxID=2727403 RepID=A0AAW2SC74_9LAMI